MGEPSPGSGVILGVINQSMFAYETVKVMGVSECVLENQVILKVIGYWVLTPELWIKSINEIYK